MSDLYLAELHRLRVIDKQSVLQSRYPEISLAVAIQRDHGFVIYTRTQVTVAVESLLIVIYDRISLVYRSYPQVVVGVLEHLLDAEIRRSKRKASFVLVPDHTFVAVIMEKPMLLCIDQERMFVVGIYVCDICFPEYRMRHETFRHFSECIRHCVINAETVE